MTYNGLSPGRRQVIIWTNAGILLIGPLGTNFSEMVIEIHKLSFKKMRLKVPSAKWRPFCLGLNSHVRIWECQYQHLLANIGNTRRQNAYVNDVLRFNPLRDLKIETYKIHLNISRMSVKRSLPRRPKAKLATLFTHFTAFSQVAFGG